MSKSFCTTLLILLTATSFLHAEESGAPASSSPNEAFWTAYQSRRANISAMRASFVQTTHIEGEADEEDRGAVLFVEPSRLILRFADPEIAYLVDKETAYVYDRELAQVQVGSLREVPETDALFVGFGKNMTRLEEVFTVTVVEASSDSIDSSHAVTLIPRARDDDAESAPLFRKAVVQLSRDSYLPLRIDIDVDADVSTTYRFDPPELNPALGEDETQIALHKGDKIVVEGDFVEKVETERRLIPERPLPDPLPDGTPSAP